MTPDDASARAIGELCGAAVTGRERVAGGDVAQAERFSLADGRSVFVKRVAGGPPGLLAAEAAGLRWLAEANALRTPDVLGVTSDGDALVLEWIETGGASRSGSDDHDEALGRGLAALHRTSCGEVFGGVPDNFIATLPQSNEPASEPGSWPAFYGERRLAPLVRQLHDRGRLDAASVRRFDALFARLGERCGPPEPPARLHGDLWGGNALCDETGAPVLIDPAVYAGHREIDLAMMQLFGGFSPRVFAAYDEAFPLAAGARERVALHQLYPLLVHVALFGGSYVGSLDAALASID